jgi:tetratricopeptide (TPR) repeat protein
MSSEFRQFDEHGLPIPQRYVDMRPEDDEPPRKARFSQRSKRIVLVVLILGVVIPLVVGPKIIHVVRESFADGYQNRAKQKIARHDFEGAIEDVNQAIAWNPSGWEYYQDRSIARAGKNDLAGSLEDLTKTIDVFNDAWNSGNHRRRRDMDRSGVLGSIYSRRSWMNVRLGNRDAAIDDANQAINLRDSPENLNTRAYARAVLKVDLEEGLKDVDRAIRDAGTRRERLSLQLPTARDQTIAQVIWDQQMANFLDTRGYLLCKLERNDDALKELNRAIALVEKSHKFIDDHPETFGRQGDLEELSDEATDESLAVMYHHRGEIREQMNQPELAEKDIKRAELLGYDPEKGIF